MCGEDEDYWSDIPDNELLDEIDLFKQQGIVAVMTREQLHAFMRIWKVETVTAKTLYQRRKNDMTRLAILYHSMTMKTLIDPYIVDVIQRAFYVVERWLIRDTRFPFPLFIMGTKSNIRIVIAPITVAEGAFP